MSRTFFRLYNKNFEQPIKISHRYVQVAKQKKQKQFQRQCFETAEFTIILNYNSRPLVVFKNSLSLL